MTECYFTPKKDTASNTICVNCGKEKMLHTIGEGVKPSKVEIFYGTPLPIPSFPNQDNGRESKGVGILEHLWNKFSDNGTMTKGWFLSAINELTTPIATVTATRELNETQKSALGEVIKLASVEIINLPPQPSKEVSRTAMQVLKEKLIVEVERLSDAMPNTDQYGYRAALENIINEIDAQMIDFERKLIIDAYIAGSREYYDEKGIAGISFYNSKYSK